MYFSYGVFLGEIGVTHFVFDHKPRDRSWWVCRLFDFAQSAEKADDEIDNVDQEGVENNLYDLHLSNVDHFPCSVK